MRKRQLPLTPKFWFVGTFFLLENFGPKIHNLEDETPHFEKENLRAKSKF